MSKRYARFLTAVFCLFLGGLMVWQMLLPDRERSDVENRTLQQRPALTLSSVLDGSYMEDVEAYVQDQFPLRDQWTGLKARTEQLIGKRLFNNIYLCEGETLISKVDAPADGLEKANLNYVSQLAEKSDIPMYLGLIPSAAEVWRDKLPAGAENWDQTAFLDQAAGLGLPMIDFSAALTAHADEPIFYRTDHHWTSLGAFYGANALLEVLGRESLKQESFTPEIASTSFVGTLYSQSGIHWPSHWKPYSIFSRSYPFKVMDQTSPTRSLSWKSMTSAAFFSPLRNKRRLTFFPSACTRISAPSSVGVTPNG